MNITVVTHTFRPNQFLENQAAWLALEDFPPAEMEWIIVDDLYEERHEWVMNLKVAFPVLHVPPRILSLTFDAIGAWNTAFIYAQGALVHIMSDTILPTPKVLSRHWDLYQQYGPRVMIMGPLADYTWTGAAVPWHHRESDVDLDKTVGEVLSDSFISRFAWFGRNDSVARDLVLEANGMDERMSGMLGGGDAELGIRLKHLGCRFLLDKLEYGYMVPRGGQHKPGISPNPIWESLVRDAQTKRTQWAPNIWSIRAERERTGGVFNFAEWKANQATWLAARLENNERLNTGDQSPPQYKGGFNMVESRSQPPPDEEPGATMAELPPEGPVENLAPEEAPEPPVEPTPLPTLSFEEAVFPDQPRVTSLIIRSSDGRDRHALILSTTTLREALRQMGLDGDAYLNNQGRPLGQDSSLEQLGLQPDNVVVLR